MISRLIKIFVRLANFIHVSIIKKYNNVNARLCEWAGGHTPTETEIIEKTIYKRYKERVYIDNPNVSSGLISLGEMRPNDKLNENEIMEENITYHSICKYCKKNIWTGDKNNLWRIE